MMNRQLPIERAECRRSDSLLCAGRLPAALLRAGEVVRQNRLGRLVGQHIALADEDRLRPVARGVNEPGIDLRPRKS
jgi:hypothetical protein